jgi:hypothetical protein
MTSAGVLGLILWLTQAALLETLPWKWMVFDLLFGILPMFISALLLTHMPNWLKVTPLRYVNYGLLFFLSMTSQLAFLASMALSGAPGLFYLLTLMTSWSVLLKYINGFIRSSYQRRMIVERGMFISLLWGVLVGIVLSVLLIYGLVNGVIYGVLAGNSYLFPLTLFLLVRFRRNN